MHSRTKVVFQCCIYAVHMKFAVFKYRKPELKWLVNYMIDFAPLDCNLVRVEQTKIDAFRLFGHSTRFILVG